MQLTDGGEADRVSRELLLVPRLPRPPESFQTPWVRRANSEERLKRRGRPFLKLGAFVVGSCTHPGHCLKPSQIVKPNQAYALHEQPGCQENVVRYQCFNETPCQTDPVHFATGGRE